MKKLLFILFLLFFNNTLSAQEGALNHPISIGYYHNLLFQPGPKIGTQIPFKTWAGEKVKRKRTHTLSKSYFVSPQLGFFVRPNDNTNIIVNAEIGYYRTKVERGSFSSISLGVGYWGQSQITSITYNLNDGSIKEKARDYRNYFFPTINYEFGKAFNSTISWYSKLTTGMKLSTAGKNSAVGLIELGVKLNLKQ